MVLKKSCYAPISYATNRFVICLGPLGPTVRAVADKKKRCRRIAVNFIPWVRYHARATDGCSSDFNIAISTNQCRSRGVLLSCMIEFVEGHTDGNFGLRYFPMECRSSIVEQKIRH